MFLKTPTYLSQLLSMLCQPQPSSRRQPVLGIEGGGEFELRVNVRGFKRLCVLHNRLLRRVRRSLQIPLRLRLQRGVDAEAEERKRFESCREEGEVGGR